MLCNCQGDRTLWIAALLAPCRPSGCPQMLAIAINGVQLRKQPFSPPRFAFSYGATDIFFVIGIKLPKAIFLGAVSMCSDGSHRGFGIGGFRGGVNPERERFRKPACRSLNQRGKVDYDDCTAI